MRNNKQLLIRSFVGGLVYAVLMAGWDYHDNLPFAPLKFIFYFLFFGGSIGVMDYWQMKKRNK